MSWFPCDTQLAHDNKIALLAELGEPDEWGPKAISAWVTLLGIVQDTGEAGAAFVPYRPFAALAYVEPVEAHRLLCDMAAVGLIEVETNKPDSPLGGASVTVTNWKRYRERVFNAQRQAKSRARKTASETGSVTKRDSALPRDRSRGKSKEKNGAPGSTDVSLLPNDPVAQAVVARFREAATDNPYLTVDEPKIVRVLGEFKGMSGLQAEASHCAEWLGAQNGKKRRVGHLTLRNWLKRIEQPKEAKRERRFTRPEHVSH